MAKRDYEAVAAGIRVARIDGEAKAIVTAAVAIQIERTRGNARFDRARFVDTATGYPGRTP